VLHRRVVAGNRERIEVCDRSALATLEVSRDLGLEYAARPAVFNRLVGAPEAISGALELVEQAADVAPGQLSHRLWDNFVATSCQWPCRGEAAHVV
jgi:hypothetical protein